MLSLFDTAKRILKSFFDDNLFSINDILSKTKIEALIRAIDKGIKKDYDKVLKSVNKEVRSKLKNEYNQFIKKGALMPLIQKKYDKVLLLTESHSTAITFAFWYSNCYFTINCFFIFCKIKL